MVRRILLSGLCGAVVMFLFTIIVNGLLGFNASIQMKTLPDEREVYDVLKQSVTEPGRYAVNPELTSEGRFPNEEPVFSVLYGGVGHEAAGQLALIQLPVFFVLPIVAAWILAHANRDVLTSYHRKLVFFVAIGLLVSISGRLTHFGIGDYPVHDAVALALFELVAWIVAGTVMAGIMKPVEETA